MRQKKTIIYYIAALFVFLSPCSSFAATQGEGIFTVTVEDAEKAVAKALEEKGAAEIVASHITSSRNGVLYRYGKALEVGVKTLKFTPDDQKFSANLYFVSDGEVMSVTPVSGRYEEMVALPVARNRLMRGNVITEDDLEEITYPISRLQSNMAQSADQIIGKTPQRAVSKGRPIRISELKAPSILQKGTKVQMRFLTPYMVISTVGEALEDGAKGESIRVKNFDSGKIVAAQIASSSEVVVSSTPFRIE